MQTLHKYYEPPEIGDVAICGTRLTRPLESADVRFCKRCAAVCNDCGGKVEPERAALLRYVAVYTREDATLCGYKVIGPQTCLWCASHPGAVDDPERYREPRKPEPREPREPARDVFTAVVLGISGVEPEPEPEPDAVDWSFVDAFDGHALAPMRTAAAETIYPDGSDGQRPFGTNVKDRPPEMLATGFPQPEGSMLAAETRDERDAEAKWRRFESRQHADWLADEEARNRPDNTYAGGTV